MKSLIHAIITHIQVQKKVEKYLLLRNHIKKGKNEENKSYGSFSFWNNDKTFKLK